MTQRQNLQKNNAEHGYYDDYGDNGGYDDYTDDGDGDLGGSHDRDTDT